MKHKSTILLAFSEQIIAMTVQCSCTSQMRIMEKFDCESIMFNDLWLLASSAAV